MSRSSWAIINTKNQFRFVVELTLILVLSSYNAISQSDQSHYKTEKHHVWTYNGESGPDHWFELDKDYEPCGTGLRQSPIDILSQESVLKKHEIIFNYRSFLVKLKNNGHTLIDQIVEPEALTLDDINYNLLQFHFHTPAEHRIDHKEYPMEIHFVHQNKYGNYAVIAVFIEEGDMPNVFLNHFMNCLPEHVDEEKNSLDYADPKECFPKELDYFIYQGSLTTPPCTEGVTWVVMRKSVQATKEQIESIHKIIKDDNRPLQQINQRTIHLTSFN